MAVYPSVEVPTERAGDVYRRVPKPGRSGWGETKIYFLSTRLF